jgi:hypothetical protein
MSENRVSVEDVGGIVQPRRIDGPHSVGSPKPEIRPATVLVEMAAVGGKSATAYPLDSSGLLELEEDYDAREERLENQAAQLADQLQSQLREIERREAQQNARSAELDNEFRRARFWITEKSAELAERENLVAAAEARLAADRDEASQTLEQSNSQLHEVEARQKVLIKSEQELVQRQQLLVQREADLAERERQFEAKEFHLRERLQFIERAASNSQAEMSRREQALQQGESLLAEHTHALERDQQTLARERSDWQRQKEIDREANHLQRQRADAELEQSRTRLAAREQALDKQQVALDQLRSEITAAHRQSLEMRMIAEQLWGQVQGRIPPAEVTQSLAQLRLKLGEQYRLEQHGLTQQKEELLTLAERVAEQSAALRGQRQELQAWFAAREEEIERQAEGLVHREQELQDLSDQLGQSSACWQTDRRALEQQLREAHSRLRQVAA